LAALGRGKKIDTLWRSIFQPTLAEVEGMLPIAYNK